MSNRLIRFESSAFNLLRASAKLAQAPAHNPDDKESSRRGRYWGNTHQPLMILGSMVR